MAKRTTQAYKRAPWRRQMQAIGLSLIPIVLVAVGISVYLIISAQAAAAGLEIMDLHFTEEDILREIANQRSNLAYITSYAQMQKKAKKMGFESPPQEILHHITINGYQGQQPVLVAPPPGEDTSASSIVNAAYQESLSSWIFTTFFSTASDGGRFNE